MSVLLVASGLLGYSGQVVFTYLLTPILIWCAFRFSQRETATAIFTITQVAIIGLIIRGQNRVDVVALNDSLLLLEVSMAITFITMMALTALMQDQKKLETALVTHNEDLVRARAEDMAIIESIGEGLLVMDQKGTIAFANSHAKALLRRDADELIGVDYATAVPVQDSEGRKLLPHERAIFKVLATGRKIVSTPSSTTYYYIRGDGTRFPVSYAKTPIVDQGKVVGAVEVFRDVTKSKEIDQIKSEFVSLASHQLRTPLSIINMYAELLQGTGGLFERAEGSEYQEYAREIGQATGRMTNLINDLLHVSRIDTGMLTVLPQLVDAEKLVRDALEDVKETIKKKGLIVTTRYPKQAFDFVTDKYLYGIVIQNLISNAAKYAKERGRVVITVTKAGQEVVMKVSDTGYGIPKHQKKDIFKRLFRADNVRTIEEGTGLGLYIVKAFTERLGGTISFNSKEGSGSTFTVRFPLSLG